MAQDIQQAQEALIHRALADPRVAEAVRAYDAVRPFVPEQTWARITATYTSTTNLTVALPDAR